MRNRRHRRNSGGSIVKILFFVGLLVGAGYIYTAGEFEREAPVVTSKVNQFWNRIEPLSLHLSDNKGLKSYAVILSDGTTRLTVAQGMIEEQSKEKTLLVTYPKDKGLNPKATKLQLIVSVTDNSFWNFLQGNTSETEIEVDLDFTRPRVEIVANSYSITQGGSALVIFYAKDKNLKKVYIQAGEKKFRVQPYKKKGYYVALLAWDFAKSDFNAKVIAIDKAKNKRVTDIPLLLRKYKYDVSWIKARDNFIDGKISDLASSNPEYAQIEDRLERLKAINETMRLKNEELIHSYSQNLSSELLTSWKMKRFYPLKSAKKVASYGAHRHYYYETKENEISESYHVGYDLASTKMATVRTSNAGKVVFANENGIYGNMPIIDHGLGLFSLYGHCSELLVSEGDILKAGDAIGKTGVSGLALGDHLHFGLLVQGLEVRPIEWFDKNWIITNIDNVFRDADKIIEE